MERLTNHYPGYQPYVITANKPTWRSIYDKLCAYEDAEEQGLLVRLPCKVGDTCYMIHTVFGEKSVSEEKFFLEYLDILGKRVFATREEAEAALAKEREP